MNLIYPFGWNIWSILVASILVYALCFYLVSKWETKLIGISFEEWDTFGESLFYSLGTFLGESCTRGTKSDAAKALRILIGVWILYCFIMAQAYSGILRSFLITPSYEKPILTLQEVKIMPF